MKEKKKTLRHRLKAINNVSHRQNTVWSIKGKESNRLKKKRKEKKDCYTEKGERKTERRERQRTEKEREIERSKTALATRPSESLLVRSVLN